MCAYLNGLLHTDGSIVAIVVLSNFYYNIWVFSKPGCRNLNYQTLFCNTIFWPIFTTMAHSTKMINTLILNTFCCPVDKASSSGDITINARIVGKTPNSPCDNINLHLSPAAIIMYIQYNSKVVHI